MLMIALLSMCRCDLWVKGLLLLWLLLSLKLGCGIWCWQGVSVWRSRDKLNVSALTFSLT